MSLRAVPAVAVGCADLSRSHPYRVVKDTSVKKPAAAPEPPAPPQRPGAIAPQRVAQPTGNRPLGRALRARGVG